MLICHENDILTCAAVAVGCSVAQRGTRLPTKRKPGLETPKRTAKSAKYIVWAIVGATWRRKTSNKFV